MFKHLFKEYEPLKDAFFNDTYVINMHIVGGVMIAITFFVIGLLCLLFSGLDPQVTRKRVMLTKMFGFFLITCAIARVIDVMCIWHDYAVINGYVKILTGFLALIAIFMIPSILREGIEQRKLREIKQGLTETNQKIDDLKEISEKLNNDK